MTRNYRFDNIKFLLITLVVFGHLLELVNGQTSDSLYRVIYLFHIPAFLFITGYFARFDPAKILYSFILPYLLLQILYALFQSFVISENHTVSLQMTKPYWLLWYLMTVTFYYLLIPFLDTRDTKKQILFVTVSIVLSLLAGFDKQIGYFLSLSRFFTFLPFFLTGYYLSKNTSWEKKISKKAIPPIFLISMSGVIVSVFYILNVPLRYQVLYGSYSYEAMEYGPGVRFLLLLFAFCWIILLLQIVPNKKWKYLSVIGKNTFPIFVLHGFLVRLAAKYTIFTYSELLNLLLALIISGGILILLGNKYTARVFSFLFIWNNQKK